MVQPNLKTISHCPKAIVPVTSPAAIDPRQWHCDINLKHVARRYRENLLPSLLYLCLANLIQPYCDLCITTDDCIEELILFRSNCKRLEITQHSFGASRDYPHQVSLILDIIEACHHPLTFESFHIASATCPHTSLIKPCPLNLSSASL